MSTPVFNNGIFLRDNNYNLTSDIDSYHLLSMLKDADPMDMGLIDIWAQTQKVEMPLYSMSSFEGKNTIDVDHPQGQYKWETPISQDLPYVVEDIEPGNTRKGVDGQTFRVKFNKREFGHGDIITYDKFTGVELYVDPNHDIFPLGKDAFIYTLKLVNNNSDVFLNNDFLKPGTKFYRIGSAIGEYGERRSKIQINAGVREFYNYVGNSSAHAEYSVTSHAKLMADGYMKNDGNLPVTEIWRYFGDDDLNPSVTTLNDFIKTKGMAAAKEAMASGALKGGFLSKMEAAHITKVARDIENYLMWGKGGVVSHDGADDLRLSVGLWKQTDNSFIRVYNKPNFSLQMFRSELYNFFAGRVEFTGPDPQRKVVVQTGMGGMQMVNELIADKAANAGFVIQAAAKDGIGAITGQGMNLGFGYAYTSFIIPFIAEVHFVINPALDNVHTNDIENPIIDGFPLSSYSFIIFDVTENANGNIKLLKKKNDPGLRWWYNNGTMDYFGRTKGFQGGRFSGFEVYFEQNYPAIWVEDPTKILKIVMKNPKTGGHL